MNNKEEVVKQHAKVAEEAVSGWEKAEAEAATLKTHLEAVTLSKLTTEDRAAHLDNALKECMRPIRNIKEKHEKKVQDVVITKNMQYGKMEIQRERDLRRSEWMRKMEEAMNKPSNFLHFLEAPEEAPLQCCCAKSDCHILSAFATERAEEQIHRFESIEESG